MMKEKIFLLLIIGCLFSCNTREKDTASSDQQTEIQNTDSIVNCYRYSNKTDMIELKIVRIGNAITGTLVYNLDGKDKNTGTIQGVINGNLLVADYLFMSEGIQSTRQVAFKLENNIFIEGYGDITIQNDSAYFKNMDSLQFNDGMKLIEIPCEI